MKPTVKSTPAMGTPGDAPGTGRQAARDRVLLYTRTLGLEPIAELALARETLRGVPSGVSDPESVRLAMDALDAQMKTLDASQSPAHWVQPPLNRRPMLAEPMEMSLLRPLSRFLLRPLRLRPRSPQPNPPDHDKA